MLIVSFFPSSWFGVFVCVSINSSSRLMTDVNAI